MTVETIEARVGNDPHFRQLVRERTRFGWVLTGIMLVIYFGFIGLIAFDRSLMGARVGGGTASVGLLLGLGVILSAFALTGIYVARANGRFDELTARINRDAD